MAGPHYGVVGGTFKIVRVLQAVSLIAIIGMAANFISEMVQNNNTPSDVVVGTLSVTCIAVIYCAITYILFIDSSLPFLITTGMDGMLLIALIVVAVVVGKPLSYVNCQIIGTSSVAESAAQLSNELQKGWDNHGEKVTYSNWIGAKKSTCLEMKAIWGLSIAL
ncbi:hypothetical protein MMC29_007497, partial [Sticta canariensis]|nr:hypothetical protein [Sticta canariensis]